MSTKNLSLLPPFQTPLPEKIQEVTSSGFAYQDPIWEPILKGYKDVSPLTPLLICWMTLGKLPQLSGL